MDSSRASRRDTVASSGRYLIRSGLTIHISGPSGAAPSWGFCGRRLEMNKYYLIANPPTLVLRRCSSSSSCIPILFLPDQGTSNRRDHPFWPALDFLTRSAEGFVILPSVRHESTMTPFLFNVFAIGTVPAYPSSEIAHTGPARSDSLRPAM